MHGPDRSAPVAGDAVGSAEFVELLELLDLELLDPDGLTDDPRRFRGRSPRGRTRSVFGGQFVAQSLVAAGRTVPEGRVPHSLHAYFLRAGDPLVPIDYAVETIRDGRSYHHRQVVASQDGREVFRLLAGFTVDRPGPRYQPPLPGPPPDGTDPAGHPGYVRWTMASSTVDEHPWEHEPTPLEITFEDAPAPVAGEPVFGVQRMWLRLQGTVPSDDPVLHAALLAWMSDKTLADLAILAHGSRWVDDGVVSLSLDHSMWFLEPVRADGWIRFDQQVDHTAGGRGLVRGSFVTPDGRQVAVATQEATVGLPDD